ncbi:hypothetical protein AHAS_Ahas19G0285200 [Arachis hypogaea]
MSPSPLTAHRSRDSSPLSPRRLPMLAVFASERHRVFADLHWSSPVICSFVGHVKQKQQPKRPPLGAPFGFNDDEDNDVEREVTLQGSKKKTLKDQKKALEEDPTVFDYDGVYDKIKEKCIRPLIQDRKERKILEGGNMRIELSKELQRHAKVEAKVIYDRESGRSRCFGFVTYSSLEEVNSAIESLDGALFVLLFLKTYEKANISAFSYCDMYILFCPVVLWNHELPLTYDFHNYMLKSMDDEFRDIVGVR